ncbi:unnamed protein product [Hermetia illucens]|uniref:Uncharacterized protein n=1 Tax=Hermetia illucens TaxID=343691 RepID=A0A7R8Z055_HERIL|nr:ejaculatory bulb-specific protein 3-like [Hermetia illucens]XP_037923650.1 ejaculatory bulb-specific protein 3-like [Hermetia illucens]CAD7091999.1 unnamed protein product [Hermetia illucens]
MKFLLVSVVLCSVVCIFGQQYTQKYDNIDVDSVLSNDRIRSNYVKCLLETGPCTPEGRELRNLLPEALATNCAKCTAVQSKNLVKTLRKFENSETKEWKLLTRKYDPKGTYIAAFRKSHQ